jgi:hypothetical protein
MKAIDKFILHVVHNWKNKLNEAYGKEVMDNLIKKFREEADDLNIKITDEQLKKYIERFDQIKDSPKTVKKNIQTYTLSELIRLVRSMPGSEPPSKEEEDQTPDVVYSDNGITIWNGAKQGNCIVYGASQKLPGGSKWCITEPGGSYFGTYRYGASYGYPTFYLAKNSNLSDNDKLSFVSLQVLKNGDYKFTNRNNSPGMEGPFSWEELNSKVPWLKDIPNLKNILKYIPFTKSEKEADTYRNNPISIKQWIKEPFDSKRQYLFIRAGNRQLFSDITNDLFISKYLPQYSQIATIIAGTAGIIDINRLIQYLDKFSKQDQSSIVKQIRDKFALNILDEDLSFDLKKYLVKTDKIDLDSNQRLYVTKDNQAIVLLTLKNNIKVGLYTEDDEYPNIKLNKRTSKYLLDYPELDKIPLKNLFKLVEDEIIDREFVNDILNKAKDNPNSAIIVKPTEDGDIVLDSNTFSSYKIKSDGSITSIPFNSEEVEQVFASAKDSEGFQQNALNIFKEDKPIPNEIDKKALASVISSIPYSQRILNNRGNDSFVLLTSNNSKMPFFTMRTDPADPSNHIRPTSTWNAAGEIGNGYGDFNNDEAISYFAYLRQMNKSFNDNDLRIILNSTYYDRNKKAFATNNPPVNADNVYRIAQMNNDVVLINTQNSRESFMLSSARNNLKKLNLPPQYANQLLGIAAPAAAAGAPAGGRRGRPAGVPNAPRPQQPAAAAAQGNINVGARMQAAGLMDGFMGGGALPRSIFRRLNVNDASAAPVANNRGASRRQNILGDAGQVTSVLNVGESTIYFIRLGNGSTVASIVVQPGNGHYLITPQSQYQLESPSQLLTALQQRNLAEVHQYLVNEYMERNPEHLNEFKELLRKHINEKKK